MVKTCENAVKRTEVIAKFAIDMAMAQASTNEHMMWEVVNRLLDEAEKRGAESACIGPDRLRLVIPTGRSVRYALASIVEFARSERDYWDENGKGSRAEAFEHVAAAIESATEGP
jgi:hypothetical protein